MIKERGGEEVPSCKSNTYDEKAEMFQDDPQTTVIAATTIVASKSIAASATADEKKNDP